MNPKNAVSDPQRRPNYEPLYDVDSHTGATIEVFYADHILTGMRSAGWHWWSCKPGSLPEWPPNGPFATRYRAYCDALRCVGMTLEGPAAAKAVQPTL
jgi:hypothetical protein